MSARSWKQTAARGSDLSPLGNCGTADRPIRLRRMSTHVLFVDFLALMLAVLGFHLAFRQRLVRRLWRSWRPANPAAPPRQRREGEDEDSAHYAMIISGMMMLAFGVVIALFVTSYALMT